MISILEGIDLDWWKRNSYSLVLDQYLGEPEKITIELGIDTFYKIDKAVKEMEKNIMLPKICNDITLTCDYNMLFKNGSSISIPQTKAVKFGVKSIKYSGKYTTVTWNDGTKTRVSCGDGEQQSRYSAFCSALAIKIFGTNSQVKKIVKTKDEQIEIDKQNKIREEQERVAKIRNARKDRLWVKKRAKELALEQRAQEMAKQLLSK